MFVNLTEVLLNEGRTVTMQIEPELAQVTVGGETYPVGSRHSDHYECREREGGSQGRRQNRVPRPLRQMS